MQSYWKATNNFRFRNLSNYKTDSHETYNNHRILNKQRRQHSHLYIWIRSWVSLHNLYLLVYQKLLSELKKNNSNNNNEAINKSNTKTGISLWAINNNNNNNLSNTNYNWARTHTTDCFQLAIFSTKSAHTEVMFCIHYMHASRSSLPVWYVDNILRPFNSESFTAVLSLSLSTVEFWH